MPSRVSTSPVGSVLSPPKVKYEKKLLAIPFSDYSRTTGESYWDSFVSEIRVFGVDTQSGITPRGALSLKDVYVMQDDYGWRWWYSPWVRRSVMASDGDQTFVYAISDAGVRVANLDAVTQPLATVLFPRTPYP